VSAGFQVGFQHPGFQGGVTSSTGGAVPQLFFPRDRSREAARRRKRRRAGLRLLGIRDPRDLS
jgi:hypothetical protein